MRRLLFVFISVWLSAAGSLGRNEPLANAGKRGLDATSIEDVLRLREDQVDLAVAALIISEHWSDMVPGMRYLERLDQMAYEIRNILGAKNLGPDYRAIPVLNEYLFQKEGFHSLEKVSDPNDLFLHYILDRKRGYCLSLSVLYLSLGERLGLPLYGVVVPGHFFVRYDDGTARFNIETTSKGGMAPDQHYIDKFKVPPGNRDSIYLKNIGKIQTLGCFFNNLGNTYSAIGDVEHALLALERAVQINPSLAESRMNLGNIYLKKGRVDDAIYQYRTALQINPNDAKSHLNLGNAYMERGWIWDAVGEYTLSMRLDANVVEAYKNLAAAYSKQKMFAEAIVYLEQAMILEPTDGSLYSWLGDVYRQMDDCEQAITQYKKAVKIKPDLAVAYHGLGMCYGKLERSDEEIEAYKKAVAIDPAMVAALVNLGNAYGAREKYDAAIEQYNKAIKIAPDDATIYYNLGAAYFNKRDYQKAVTAHEKAVQIDPKMADAHKALAVAFYYLKKYEPALKHLRIAEQLGVEIDSNLRKAIESKSQ